MAKILIILHRHKRIWYTYTLYLNQSSVTNISVASTTWYPATVLSFVVAHVLAYTYQCIYQIWSNPQIISQDIELKHNSKINQESLLCWKVRENNVLLVTTWNIYIYSNAINTIYQNPFITSKDIEKNWNFNINHGQCWKVRENLC